MRELWFDFDVMPRPGSHHRAHVGILQLPKETKKEEKTQIDEVPSFVVKTEYNAHAQMMDDQSVPMRTEQL